MGFRILHAIPTVNPVGGGPIEGLRQLSRENKRLGHSVEVVSLDNPDDQWVLNCELPCYAVGPSLGTYRYSPRLIPWLRENAHRFDAVIVNGIWTYMSFGVWRALRNTKTPYFVFTHGMLDPHFKRQYPLKHLKKWLYWPWAEYRVLRDATATFFTCEEERRLARQSFWLYHCDEYVVNYGTAGATGDAEAQRDLFLEKHPHLRGKRCLLFLGRVHEKKGSDLTLKALAQCLSALPLQQTANVHLIMAGPDDGEYAQTLKTLSAKLGIENRITWTGMLTGDLKWGAFHASDAFVLNSHQENFGIAVVEALSAGLPTLITNKVNIWREIQQAGAGFVDSDDAAGSIRLLRRWLDVLPDDWAAMRNRARECFLSRFHISKSAQSFMCAMEIYGMRPEQDAGIGV
ncbi:glycosyltransferase [Paraburkholderia sp. GAS348]|uniref:glycosyltransferase n=1 Tax=Paraburkholderia sp. GAS348 TaxID=3035132 RepID=UPI003D200967